MLFLQIFNSLSLRPKVAALGARDLKFYTMFTTCHMSHVIFYDDLLELVGGGSVIIVLILSSILKTFHHANPILWK